MKTAVEWFYQRILAKNIESVFEQAKEMEKEQIAQAFEDGEHNYFYSKKTGEDFENGIEYYNEKFKNQEQ
jgi:hypothetical protein